MKRIAAVFGLCSVICGSFAACARERPPPRMCETAPPPAKKKEEVRIGTCPIEWGHDSGTDAPADASPDARHDAHPDG